MRSATVAALAVFLAAAPAAAPAARAVTTGGGGAGTAAAVSADSGGTGAGNGVRDRFLVSVVDGSVRVLVDGALAGSYDAATLASLTVHGSGDDDTLTVDFGGGNPIPPGGLFYHGGGNAAAGDALRLVNGSFAEVTYSYYNATDGVIDLGGSLLTFTGLEPILDSVPAATLTVNATNAHNAITYSQGGTASRGLVSVDNYETIEFENKTALVLNALSGGDDVVLGNLGVPTGLTSITVHGGNGDDRFYVAFDSPVALTLNGDEGDDLFRVNPSGAAVVEVHGGEHAAGDLLRVNRRGSALENRTRRGVIWLEGFANIPYTGIERFRFNND